MNIIFLDFYGVLKSLRSSIAYNEGNEVDCNSLAGSCMVKIEFKKESFNLDSVCLQYLKNIVDEYDCKIVISSSWRAHSCLEHFHRMFQLYGWDTKDIVIGLTPITCNGIRGEDIKQWMADNPNISIDNYVILDDNNDILPEQFSHFVQTDSTIGLNYIDIEKVGKIMARVDKNA